MKRSWLWTLTAVLAIAALSYAAFVILRPPAMPPGFQYGSGHIEGTQVRLAAEVGGRILQQSLAEGRRVAHGQHLVVVDHELGRDMLKWLSRLSPLRYHMEILQGVFLKGSGWRELWPQAVALLAIGSTLFALAAATFRRRLL